jgi:hypothetical protein
MEQVQGQRGLIRHLLDLNRLTVGVKEKRATAKAEFNPLRYLSSYFWFDHILSMTLCSYHFVYQNTLI